MSYIQVFLLGIIVYCSTNMVHGTCYKELESKLFDDLLNMMSKLKCTAPNEDKKPRHTTPAFGASTGIHKNLAEYEIVKFEKVWTNIENCYDHYTGVFTAPRTGVYQFSCTAMTYNNEALRLHLYKNELQIVSLWPGSSGYNMGTLSMVLELTKGDKVYIKHANGPEVSLYSEKGSHFTMFSGYMISI